MTGSGSGYLWSSGKVSASQSVKVAFGGAALPLIQGFTTAQTLPQSAPYMAENGLPRLAGPLCVGYVAISARRVSAWKMWGQLSAVTRTSVITP